MVGTAVVESKTDWNSADLPLTGCQIAESVVKLFFAVLPGVFGTRAPAYMCGRIGVTDSTCFYTNPDLTHSGLGDLPFHYPKHARLRYFHRHIFVFHINVLTFVRS